MASDTAFSPGYLAYMGLAAVLDTRVTSDTSHPSMHTLAISQLFDRMQTAQPLLPTGNLDLFAAVMAFQTICIVSLGA